MRLLNRALKTYLFVKKYDVKLKFGTFEQPISKQKYTGFNLTFRI